MAVEWNRISDGDINIRIYPGGIAGGEGDMIRKMRFNSLQGAVLTGFGINQIASDALAMSLPFLIQNDEEFDFVLENVRDYLENKIAKEGFIVVTWTMAGWVHFFGVDPIVYPDDLKKMRLATSSSDPAMAQAFKVLGYNTVMLEINEVLSGLTSGMVEACYIVPLGAAAYQWFGVANNMCDLPFAPVIGCIVVTERTWRQIDDEIKPELLASVERIAEGLREETYELEEEAMEIMKDNGLVINEVTPAAKRKWEEEFNKGFPIMIWQTFSQEIYDLITQYIEEYRSSN
jgi:TRAP-type C4-dicarboxylate transport system substrate-binding protein